MTAGGPAGIVGGALPLLAQMTCLTSLTLLPAPGCGALLAGGGLAPQQLLALSALQRLQRLALPALQHDARSGVMLLRRSQPARSLPRRRRTQHWHRCSLASPR